MKAFGSSSVLVLVIGAALICTFSNPGAKLTWRGNDTTATVKNRKLKDNGFVSRDEDGDSGKVHLEDYRPMNPVPSSKASIRPGPIQHGTPLLPYIPKPPAPPPNSSKPVG